MCMHIKSINYFKFFILHLNVYYDLYHGNILLFLQLKLQLTNQASDINPNFINQMKVYLIKNHVFVFNLFYLLYFILN